MRGLCSLVLGVGAAIAIPAGFAFATTADHGGRAAPPASWMPDVAPRVASLRRNLARADEEARVRRDSDQPDDQWWRATVVVPRTEVRR